MVGVTNEWSGRHPPWQQLPTSHMCGQHHSTVLPIHLSIFHSEDLPAVFFMDHKLKYKGKIKENLYISATGLLVKKNSYSGNGFKYSFIKIKFQFSYFH